MYLLDRRRLDLLIEMRAASFWEVRVSTIAAKPGEQVYFGIVSTRNPKVVYVWAKAILAGQENMVPDMVAAQHDKHHMTPAEFHGLQAALAHARPGPSPPKAPRRKAAPAPGSTLFVWMLEQVVYFNQAIGSFTCRQVVKPKDVLWIDPESLGDVNYVGWQEDTDVESKP